MSKGRYVATRPSALNRSGPDLLTLADIENLVRLAREHGFGDDAEFGTRIKDGLPVAFLQEPSPLERIADEFARACDAFTDDAAGDA